MNANLRVCEKCPHFLYPVSPSYNGLGRIEKFSYKVLDALWKYKPNAYYCRMRRGTSPMIATIDDEGVKLNRNFHVPERCPMQLEHEVLNGARFESQTYED